MTREPPTPTDAARFHALGTTVVVLIEPETATPSGPTLAAARQAVAAEIAVVDAACSRFREDAELVALDRARGAEREVSAVLFDALQLAVRAAALTEGLVDPTVGSVLSDLGYDRDFALLPRTGPARTITVAPRANWRHIELQPATRRVRVPFGVRLDLGATAKAWCADRAAQAAFAATGVGVLVSIGGDLSIAGPAPEGGWPIQLSDDHAAPLLPAGHPADTVALGGGGLATSGTAVRRWSRGGRAYHHIVDPATGAPAAPCWRSVSVAAATCADANIASTAAIILGSSAPAWLAARDLPARLVREDGHVSHVAGWPQGSQGPQVRPC